MQRLRGTRALITGGSSGLGRAVAVRFAAEGARVVVTGRRAGALDETLTAVRAAGSEGAAVVADHARPEASERAVSEAVGYLGGLDVLVNAAGIIGFEGVLESEPEKFRSMLETNLLGVYEVSRHAAPHLVAAAAERGDASVLNVSSVAGLRPYAGSSATASARPASTC